MDNQGDAAADGVWMTYSQIAAARGIKRSAAQRLVQRHKWQRREGSNDGFAHVLVPPDMAKPARPVSAPRRRPPTSPPDVVSVAVLEAALTALRQQLDRQHELHDQARTGWTEERTRLEAAWSEERARLHERIDGLELERATTRALTRWARIRRAWRGE